MTSDHQFVVSCWNVTSLSYDVVEVDTKRRQVVVSYTNQLKSTTQHKFSWPRHLSVDKNNEFILVADTGNNRIVILNRSLKCDARELNVMMSVDGGLQHRLSLF
jgi:6-phosphogluconolactonase (cycloisomerase 2 family)